MPDRLDADFLVAVVDFFAGAFLVVVLRAGPVDFFVVRVEARRGELDVFLAVELF